MKTPPPEGQGAPPLEGEVTASPSRIERSPTLDEHTSHLALARGQLDHINRLTELGVLSASLLHELRQPLSVIKSYAEMMLAEDPEDADPRLRALHTAAEGMHILISRFVSFSRSEGAERYEALHIHQPVEDALGMLEYRFKRGRIQLTRYLQEGLPRVHGETLGLRQIVANLLLNGLDALEGCEGPRMWIVTQRTPEGVEVLVGDNGVGVRPDLLNRLFHLYVTSKPEGKGTGLGLAISRGIAEAHGGSLELISDPMERLRALPPQLRQEGEPLPVTLFRLRIPLPPERAQPLVEAIAP